VNREDLVAVAEAEGHGHVVTSRGRSAFSLRCHLPAADDATEPKCPYRARDYEFDAREFDNLPATVTLCKVCDPNYHVDYGRNSESASLDLEGLADPDAVDDEDDLLTIPESNGGFQAMLADAERRRQQLAGGERE
jgi:hypothetical protein